MRLDTPHGRATRAADARLVTTVVAAQLVGRAKALPVVRRFARIHGALER